MQQTKDTLRKEGGGPGRSFQNPIYVPAAFSLHVCNRYVTNTHTLTAGSQEGQIGHATDALKLFRGRLSTRLLEIRVNTFPPQVFMQQ